LHLPVFVAGAESVAGLQIPFGFGIGSVIGVAFCWWIVLSSSFTARQKIACLLISIPAYFAMILIWGFVFLAYGA
jgi:hypothetical protein